MQNISSNDCVVVEISAAMCSSHNPPVDPLWRTQKNTTFHLLERGPKTCNFDPKLIFPDSLCVPVMGERGGTLGFLGAPDTEFLIIWTPWSVLERAIACSSVLLCYQRDKDSMVLEILGIMLCIII